jgi:hypothetical protein
LGTVQLEIDWAAQRVEFEPDGSLRDIYVDKTSLDDWRAAVALVRRLDRSAALRRAGVRVPLDGSVDRIFAEDDRAYLLTFRICGVRLAAHFFVQEQIEFDLSPSDVRSGLQLRALLEFVSDLSNVTGKVCVLTPENVMNRPIFRCDPAEQRLRYMVP